MLPVVLVNNNWPGSWSWHDAVHVFYGVRLHVRHQPDPQQLGERMSDDAADHDCTNAP